MVVKVLDVCIDGVPDRTETLAEELYTSKQAYIRATAHRHHNLAVT